MQYCCHVWAGTHSCCLETLDKVQKRRCRTVGSSLVSSLETLTHRRNEASLILFYRYYCRRCLLNWVNWFLFLIFEGENLLFILIDCLILLSPFSDVTKMSILIVSFIAQVDSTILCL